MIITLISEPRTGSTNLMEWFKKQKSFDTLLLPSYENSPDYKKNITPKDYHHNNSNLFIKEEFRNRTKNFDELISVSDYVIFLYRKNFDEQVVSWSNSMKTKNFRNQWVYDKDNFSLTTDEIEEFKILKEDFNETYLKNSSNFKISYEELYFNNGIEKIKNYLFDLKLETINFPLGEKYRIDVSNKKLI